MPRTRVVHDAFAQCTPGLERLVQAELRSLGIRTGRRRAGGVEMAATTRQLYAANLWLRTASRVIVRVARFGAPSFDALVRGAASIDWAAWLAPGTRPVFRVSTSRSALHHRDAVAERLEAVVAAEVGVPPAEADRPEQLFVVRIDHDEATISADSSGEPLHKRGWRLDVGRAPLRETLAAAVLVSAGWDGTTPLVDPFCGSGTLAIEAALVARNDPPGAFRTFAFGGWPTFEPGTWASVMGDAERAGRPSAVAVWAADRDAGAVAATQANAERAEVGDDLVVRAASVSALEAPPGGPGLLVANPPYGARVGGGGDLRDLYARFGDVARRVVPGWTVALLVADVGLARHTRLPLEERLHTSNGGIDVRVLVGRVPTEGDAVSRRSTG